MQTISGVAVELTDWLTGEALPFWATTGYDAQHRRFEERLTLAGERLPLVPLRLMSQARQVYVYSLAARRGWYGPSAMLVEEAYASMVRDFHARDGRNGWIHSIQRDGQVADERCDFYSLAFALLAIASYVQTSGRLSELTLAERTLADIDARLSAPRGGGFLDALPPIDDIRRQNPHMHLLESLLALWDCSGDARYLARAGEIFGLFVSRFFLPDRGVLGEYFSFDLAPLEPIDTAVVEPGHHYEWIWLLRRFEAATGRSVGRFVDALYAHADRYGYDHDGFVIDELLADGTPRTRSRRTWPATEGIKANIAEASMGRRGAIEKAIKLAVTLRKRFLAGVADGGWMDRLDADGFPATDFMPASTFYHVVCAIDEMRCFAFGRQIEGDSSGG